ncbi:MAG: LysE family translocator [Sneathiellales bacterium]|nr:LysE family translocator [Sneathiellales bacterium]
MDISQFWIFAGAVILINLVPGPDMLFTVAYSLKRGARAGFFAAIGIGTGGLVHASLSAVGITAILASSPYAFDVLRIGGAIYLIWLGINTIRQSGTLQSEKGKIDESSWRIFRKGFVTNVLNPKVALFFLAFLPQFIDPATGDPTLQIMMLGGFFSLAETVIIGTFGIFLGFSKQKLTSRIGNSPWINRISGSIFVLLGARLFFMEKN